MALRQTINQLQAQDRAHHEIRSNAGAFISDWYRDLQALLKLIRGFLAEYESDGSIRLAEEETEIEEDELGRYNAPVLKIMISDLVVRVVPIARLTAASTGRVDLVRDDRPSASDRIRIIRGVEAGGAAGVWTIAKPADAKPAGPSRVIDFGGTPAYLPLSKASLEDALDHLLRL